MSACGDACVEEKNCAPSVLMDTSARKDSASNAADCIARSRGRDTCTLSSCWSFMLSLYSFRQVEVAREISFEVAENRLTSAV
jgi:hypothetical protein